MTAFRLALQTAVELPGDLAWLAAVVVLALVA